LDLKESEREKSKSSPIKLELDSPGMHAHPEDEIVGAQIDESRIRSTLCSALCESEAVKCFRV
jgi:hypothetical protein